MCFPSHCVVYTFFATQYISLRILVGYEHEALKQAEFKSGPQHK